MPFIIILEVLTVIALDGPFNKRRSTAPNHLGAPLHPLALYSRGATVTLLYLSKTLYAPGQVIIQRGRLSHKQYSTLSEAARPANPFIAEDKLNLITITLYSTEAIHDVLLKNIIHSHVNTSE